MYYKNLIKWENVIIKSTLYATFIQHIRKYKDVMVLYILPFCINKIIYVCLSAIFRNGDWTLLIFCDYF